MRNGDWFLSQQCSKISKHTFLSSREQNPGPRNHGLILKLLQRGKRGVEMTYVTKTFSIQALIMQHLYSKLLLSIAFYRISYNENDRYKQVQKIHCADLTQGNIYKKVLEEVVAQLYMAHYRRSRQIGPGQAAIVFLWEQIGKPRY